LGGRKAPRVLLHHDHGFARALGDRKVVTLRRQQVEDDYARVRKRPFAAVRGQRRRIGVEVVRAFDESGERMARFDDHRLHAGPVAIALREGDGDLGGRHRRWRHRRRLGLCSCGRRYLRCFSVHLHGSSREKNSVGACPDATRSAHGRGHRRLQVVADRARLVSAGASRPGAMQRSVAGLSTKVLNERLRKLLRFGLIERRAYAEIPPRVEYRLTPRGRKFEKLLAQVSQLECELAPEAPRTVNRRS